MKNCFGKAIKKIIQVGQSLAITIPKEYLKAHKLKQGDRMEVIFNRIIQIEPLNVDEIKSKLEKKGSNHNGNS